MTGLETPSKATTDEAVIEMHAPRSIVADPAIAIRRASLQVRLSIGGVARAGRAPVIGVVPADHGDVFSTFRFHVEIAHDKKVLRQRRIGHGEFDRTRQRSTLGEVAKDTLLEKGDLRDALVRRDMIEMHRIDPQRAARSLDDGFKRATLQVQLVECPVTRQKQVAAGADRITRQHHVAKLETALAKPAIDHRMIDQHVAGRAESGKIGGKECRKGLNQIGIVVSAITAGDFLQRDDVRLTYAVGDPAWVETPVLAEAILDVVAYELHDTL